MVEFAAFHPENETLGRGILPLLTVMKRRGIDDNILKKHGLDCVQPDQWYPQQSELNVLQEVGIMMDFVAIGMKIPNMVECGVEVKTIHDALSLLDVGYQHNHRGPNIGGFMHKKTGKNSMQIICHNPYPSDLDYGIIYRLVQKFRPPKSAVFVVMRDPEAPNRKLGDDTCTFNISW